MYVNCVLCYIILLDTDDVQTAVFLAVISLVTADSIQRHSYRKPQQITIITRENYRIPVRHNTDNGNNSEN